MVEKCEWESVCSSPLVRTNLWLMRRGLSRDEVHAPSPSLPRPRRTAPGTGVRPDCVHQDAVETPEASHRSLTQPLPLPPHCPPGGTHDQGYFGSGLQHKKPAPLPFPSFSYRKPRIHVHPCKSKRCRKGWQPAKRALGDQGLVPKTAFLTQNVDLAPCVLEESRSLQRNSHHC